MNWKPSICKLCERVNRTIRLPDTHQPEGCYAATVTGEHVVGPGLIALRPIGRLDKPDEVAEPVTWLLLPKASFVTGACYPIDGNS